MTTPGGVTNLPMGALTLETMQSKLQDMSGAAMRSRSGERFPSIMGGSSGGSPLSDLTPFGILTRIWSEFNSAVANADPADINGPEDLPELLLSFIENLPVVGEFVGLLEAILGTYDGDDEVLLQIQSLFGFLRGDGKIDASFLFGELPTAIVDTLKVILGALTGGLLGNVELGQLIRLPSGQERNWLSTFDTAESVPAGDGFEHDATVGRTAPGSAKVTFDGAEHVRMSDPIEAGPGQVLDLGGYVRFDGYVGSGGPAVALRVLAYSAGDQLLGSQLIGQVTPSGATSSDFETVMQTSWTAPANTAYVYVRMEALAAGTAGTGHFDDLWLRKPAQSLPQQWITGLVDDLQNLLGWVQQVVQQGLNALGIPIVGDLLQQITDFAGGLADWQADTDGTAAGLDDLLGGLLTNPGALLGSLPQANVPIVSDIIKAVTGFTSGQGAPSGSNALADMLAALGSFTGSTNLTAATADEANGVGGNALANTVSIQAQVSGLVDRADAGWTARPLWASMDFTADSTFAKHLMLSLQHSHSASISGTSGVTGPPVQGDTGYANAGGGSHNHGINISSASMRHSHDLSVGNVSVNSAGPSLTPAQVTSSQAFLGYIRCGSVQDKRLFTFLAQASGTVSTFNLDVYRMSADGALTRAYSSANFAGAIGGTLGWVQHVIPAGTESVAVQPGDILAIQLRMTGSGSVNLGGITTPLPLNPPGWYPLRESAVRNPSTPAPATIAAATANAQHTSTAIPYIEAGIDTGLANAPVTITDNFDGTLSSLWLMQGPNTLGITSNQLGIIDGSSDGYSWGTFRQRVSTDNMKVGFSVSATTDREQIVWFHGRDRDNHVGLAITNSYATLYTMVGGSRTNRTQIAISSVDASYEIRCSGTTYTVWRNGTQIGSASITSGPSGRSGGVGLQAIRTGWFGLNWYGANPIDNWILADI